MFDDVLLCIFSVITPLGTILGTVDCHNHGHIVPFRGRPRLKVGICAMKSKLLLQKLFVVKQLKKRHS